MSRRIALFGLFVLLSGCALDSGASTGGLVITDRCEVTGSGTLPSGDSLAGSVVGGDVGATGSWTHVSLADGTILATPDWILCRINGSTLADFGGSATIDGVSGFTYRVSVQDRGVRGEPTLTAGARTIETLSASVDYRPTTFTDGSLTIGDATRLTIPAALPVTEGAPGTGWAVLTILEEGASESVRCRYRGNGSSARGGDRYEFRHCVGDGTTLAPGDEVDATSATLRVQSGDSHSDGCRSRTVVMVDLETEPLTWIIPRGDFYRIAVFDSRDPAEPRIILSEGDLDSGDLTVTQL